MSNHMPKNLQGLEGTWDLKLDYTCTVPTPDGEVLIENSFPDRIEIPDPYHVYDGTGTELEWTYDGNSLTILDWMDSGWTIGSCGNISQEIWFNLSMSILPSATHTDVVAMEDLILNTSDCGDLNAQLEVFGTLDKK